MSNSQIGFIYNQIKTIIQCNQNDLMRDIFNSYGNKSGLSIEELYFLYGGNKINPDETLSQLAGEATDIQILVRSNVEVSNKNKTKRSAYIKCPQCEKPATIKFSNDYNITLFEKNHGAKKINLADYNNTQIVDEEEIKCSKCSKSKSKQYEGKFYYCFECEQNLCILCQSMHKEHQNIVDYSLKYFKCPQHHDQSFISYCLDCKKNICLICGNQHEGHNINVFKSPFIEPNEENIENIKKVNESVDNIIDLLSKFKEKLVAYIQINEILNNNMSNMIFNYENVESMKNLINISFLKEDINQILSSNDFNKKFRKIMSMYDVMIGKSNKVINIDEVRNEINQETFKSTKDIKIFEDQDGINNGKSKTDSFILAKIKLKKILNKAVK